MNPDEDERNNDINRREFFRRTTKAGLSIAAASVAGYWLYGRSGTRLALHTPRSVQLKDYSIPGTEGSMSIVTGSDRLETLRVGLKALGGIGKFIAKGDRVLLKVNAAFSTPAILSATTNPELVAEFVRLSLAAGASAVIVTDNPINDPASCFALTGIGPAASSAGAKVMPPKQSYFRPTTVPGGRLIKNWPLLYEPFDRITKVIGIAPIKDHNRGGATMAMKNWYGLLGGRRNKLHQDIHNTIKELALMVSPTLVVLDGTTAMVKNGPTGGSLDDLKQTNTMILSTDQVAADAFGATLLGKSAGQLPYIHKAADAGAGRADFESQNLIRLSVN